MNPHGVSKTIVTCIDISSRLKRRHNVVAKAIRITARSLESFKERRSGTGGG